MPVSFEVRETFERLGKAGGMSTGRAMAEWLSDTVEAARYLADTLEKARKAPKLVAQQLHAYALGLTDETGQLMERMKHAGLEPLPVPAKRAPEAAPDPLTPPYSNTGGKVPQNPKKAPFRKVLKPVGPAHVQAYADNNGFPPKGQK